MSKLFGWVDKLMKILDGQPQVEILEEPSTVLVELTEDEWEAVRAFIMYADLERYSWSQLNLRKKLLKNKFEKFEPTKRYK